MKHAHCASLADGAASASAAQAPGHVSRGVVSVAVSNSCADPVLRQGQSQLRAGQWTAEPSQLASIKPMRRRVQWRGQSRGCQRGCPFRLHIGGRGEEG